MKMRVHICKILGSPLPSPHAADTPPPVILEAPPKSKTMDLILL